MARHGDTRRASVIATVAAALMIAQQVGGKATRDALFLSSFPASDLPRAVLAAVVLSLCGVALMSWSMARLGPARLIPWLYGINALAYVVEWSLLDRMPRFTAALVFLHVGSVGSLLVSGFWSVITERFDPHTAKRVVGRIASGATVGGLLGGLTADRVATLLDARSMLLVLAGFCVACGAGISLVGKPAAHDDAAPPQHAPSGWAAVKETPYLKLLAVLVTFTALTDGVIDYAFKATAAAVLDSEPRLMSFFGLFYTVTGLLTVGAQTLLARRSLHRLGIGGTLAIVPAMVVVAGTVSAALTRLWTVVLLGGAQTILYNSFHRSGYELLFTPLPPAKKRPAKTLVDVGFDRLGTALASGAVLLVLAIAPEATSRVVLVVAVACALVTLVVASRLHAGYVTELESSLRSGTVQLSESDVLDATTRRTLAETTMAIDREELLAEIQALRAQREEAPAGSAAPGPRSERTPAAVADSPPESSRPLPAAPPSLLELARALTGEDTTGMQRALRPPFPVELVGLVIPLLGHVSVARAARRVLRQLAPRIVGQLVDALLDVTLEPVVRRRLPDVLAGCPSPRVVAGLMAALGDESPEIRMRAAEALMRVVADHPELSPAPQEVLARVERELGGEEGDASLVQAFRLLSLVLDRDLVQLALGALRGNHEGLRGTALEYLENVLPPGCRDALFDRVAPRSLRERRTGPPRHPEQLAADLRRSIAELPPNPACQIEPSVDD